MNVCSYAEMAAPFFQGGFGLGRDGHCLWFSKVAQPARRVKDKRLRRAFGILDAVRWLCFVMVKGLLPTPVIQG